MEGGPSLGQDRACSTEKTFPQAQNVGSKRKPTHNNQGEEAKESQIAKCDLAWENSAYVHIKFDEFKGQ